LGQLVVWSFGHPFIISRPQRSQQVRDLRQSWTGYAWVIAVY